MDVFSTRELALGVWLCALAVFAMAHDTIRPLAVGLFKNAFHKTLWPFYVVTLLYVICMVIVLWAIGLWNQSHIKGTIFWTLSVALVSLFRLPDKAEDFSYFRQVVIDSFKLIVVLEFIVSSYTLEFWAELLVIPVSTFLVAMAEFSRGKPDYKIVHSLFENLLVALGLLLIGHALYQLYVDIRAFASLKNLSDFSLPPILTLLYLPYLYCISIYTIYKTVFSALARRIPNRAVRKYAKRKSLGAFRNNIELLMRWKRDVQVLGPTTVEAVDQSIQEVLRRRERELEPEAVTLDQGWSPYVAKEFLTEFGLTSEEYHPVLPGLDDWFSDSKHVQIGSGPLHNNISYYVDGDWHAAKQLKLLLNVNKRDEAEKAIEIFAELADTLSRKALGVGLSPDIRSALLTGTEKRELVLGKPVSVSQEQFLVGFKGFSTRFIIGEHCPSYQSPK
ncbi:MAG: hypothetical protein ACE363_02155 [Alphaproteobacteria bacterium]